MAQAATKGVVRSVSSKQGTQREYESVTILRPATSKPEIAALIERMQGMFGDFGGRLIKIDSWGTRILAFPVKHERKGIYLYWRYLGGSDIVAEFERLMGLSDKVIRFYTVKIDDDVDPEARPSEVTEELLEAASDPGPDPEELARKAAEEAARRAAEEAATARDRGDDDDDYYGDDDDDDEEND
ncbi:30S ribosomal protein S6 [Paraliomyxa miuraensis]|uniref:30S ribosomal protein S6 n=1 Tax=Paraliomyxa miuraensis TaxID=376150 RepID=UPI0022551101|nr:30S ribosomal protein S6 [Paraliomyxa miuraensis]MCX4244117.1 30S ribosomal protein S6 [Paraliomyxa miuraensis]